MQILMKNIHRKIRSKSDRKMFRQMKAQIVMIGRLKLQIQPTVNEPPPDDFPSSRSFGLPRSRFCSAGGSSKATFGLSERSRVRSVTSGSAIWTGGAPLPSYHGAMTNGSL